MKVHQARVFQEEGFEETSSISRCMVGFLFAHLHLFPGSKRNFSLPHLRECCWYLECKKTWQLDEEAALKIRLSGGEPPSQSDEVVRLENELQEMDEVIATLDEPNTQKSKRKKRTTQDESSLKKRARKLKTVEDDPPPPASPEAAVASLPTLS
jgi:hypothetical protein